MEILDEHKTHKINIKRSKPESSRLNPQQYRTCVYCATTHSFASYRKHLDMEHSHRLFLCDECDSYIDKKDLILHLSFHAIHYKSQGKHRKKLKSMREENVIQNPNPVSPAPAPQCSPKTESPQSSLITETPQSSLKTESTDQTGEVINMVCIPDTEFLENEFSDHSDMDGFEPLPESVFEAIEDSQDSQHLQDNTTDTPENRPHNDDSNKSSQPENNNLTSPDRSFEKNNKFNNSSAVIEPINRNNHAQMNIAIKDLGLPANKTPPKTAEASTSDNHPSGKKEKKNGETRKCPVCPKEFRASSSYYYHLKYVHNNNKEHKCEVCGRKFNTRFCLTQHMAIHAAQYEFECQQCQKRFKTKASLYIHEQTHSGKKPFSCSQCKMTFRWNTQLLKHRKRHAAEKGHVCDTCGRGFNVRCDLLRHARTHSAGNFPCDKCGQKFAQMRYLKVHIVKQHSTNL